LRTIPFYRRMDFIQVEGRSLIYAKTGYHSALELTMSKTNQAVRGFAVFTALPMGGKNLLGAGCRSE
jgi:hypothetical protein